MKLISVISAVLLAAAGLVGVAAPEAGAGAGAGSAGLVLRGQTEAVAKVEVPASVRGQLLEVRVKEGQSVKKGEVLARIDDAVQVQAVELARLDAEAEAEIKLAEAHVEYAQVEYERWEKNPAATDTEKRLKKLQLTQAELERDQKKEQLRQKQVVLKREQITLERMTIRSPIDGVVLRVNKAAGEATDENPLVAVVQITRLSAVFYPPKQMFARVRVGDKVKLEIATEPAVQREAVVVTVDPIIDPASGLFRVKLELDNAEGRIPAGTGAVWEGAGR